MRSRNFGDSFKILGVDRTDEDVFTRVFEHGLGIEYRVRPQGLVKSGHRVLGYGDFTEMITQSGDIADILLGRWAYFLALRVNYLNHLPECCKGNLSGASFDKPFKPQVMS
jgi:hypothetical protein